ncbi:hypothetical protein KJ780_04615, partial [Candidatus Micrarchaeota archaeon]|nr:hypothetical protein [Candidatus Micrarchaeota archaeon]
MMTDAQELISKYSAQLDHSETEIRERIAKLTGASAALQSVAYASKASLERIFDWWGEGAEQFQEQREQYMDLVYESYTTLSEQKVLLS